jgi:hypothetical protein
VEQVLSRKKVYCGNKAGMGQVIGTQKKPGFSTLIMLGMISMMCVPGVLLHQSEQLGGSLFAAGVR